MSKNRKNNKKKRLVTMGCRLLATCYVLSGFSQQLPAISRQPASVLTIDSCYSLAKKNYPLMKQIALIEKTKEYSIDNASKGYLPQLNLNGQATYQSDITQIPITLPNMIIPALSKDQYKIYGEINQSLTDFFVINQQKELIKSNTVAEEQKIEVGLYRLKERINKIYRFVEQNYSQLIDIQELTPKGVMKNW